MIGGLRLSILFSCESRRLFVGYFAVALSFGAWGVVYAFLTFAGWESDVLKGLCLVFGFATAHLVWHRFGFEQLSSLPDRTGSAIQIIRLDAEAFTENITVDLRGVEAARLLREMLFQDPQVTVIKLVKYPEGEAEASAYFLAGAAGATPAGSLAVGWFRGS